MTDERKNAYAPFDFIQFEHDGRQVIAPVFRQLQARVLQENQNMRAELNRQLFADGVDHAPYAPPTRQERWTRAVRVYVLNWRDALKAIGRAIIGRDTIPECDHDGY